MQNNEPKTTTYTFSRKFQLSIWLNMLLFFGLAVLTIYMGIIARETPNPNAPLVIALALVFVTLGYYCVDILPDVYTSITLTETQIIQHYRNGQSVAINWRDVARVRGRPILGRLEVHSSQGGQQIHIEAQIEGFVEIVAFIRRKLKIEA